MRSRWSPASPDFSGWNCVALNGPFSTFPLPLRDWMIVVAGAATVLPVLELAKWMGRRGWFGGLGS